MQIHSVLAKLQQWFGKKQDELNLKFFAQLFRKVCASTKIPFTGEPLKGIQIMGLMETRNLDFDRVFVVSANEGKIPMAYRQTSFIPFNIRKAFELPTHEFNDSLYAYLFYRILQRAKKVTILYSSLSESGLASEKSRFLSQLELEFPATIKTKIAKSNISTQKPSPIVVTKNEGILRTLERYVVDGQLSHGNFPSRLSPSALSTYLHCRLQFYFRYVKQLYEADEVNENIDAPTFGNLLHHSMESLYKNLAQRKKDDLVEPTDFFFLRTGIEGAIQEAIKKEYFVEEGKVKLDGKNILASDILKKFINRILDFDEKYAPFQMIGMEVGSREGFKMDLPVKIGKSTKKIALKGIIDRIDKKDGLIRVLDYKTGKDQKTIESIESLFDRTNKNRNKAGFQVFYYALLFFNKYDSHFEQVSVGLYNIRELFLNEFDHEMVLGKGKQKIKLSDVRPYLEDFKAFLSLLLGEIFDPTVPFDQVEDPIKCLNCPYKRICQRD